MKINLLVNSGVGESGYGLRVEPIIKEAKKRGYDVNVICRNHSKRIKDVKYIKPIPFAKIMVYFLEGIMTFVLDNKILVKLLETYRHKFDQYSAKKLIEGDIFHSWEDAPHSFKKAKKIGMLAFKESPMGNSLGFCKLFKELREFSSYISKEEIESLKIADYIFAPSEISKESLKAYGIEEERIILCPFGYDKDKFYFVDKKKDGLLKILFVGIIRERKDVISLLEAVHQINKKDIQVILCGRVHNSYRKIIKKYLKLINLKTIGYIPYDRLVKVYNSADIFVFPSLCEGSAKVIYEAMACGLPIITTKNAGSIIRNGKDGFIVPIKNVNKLKEKILYFYDNPIKIKKMGLNAIKRVSNFAWEGYGERIVDIYEKFLKNGSKKISIIR